MNKLLILSILTITMLILVNFPITATAAEIKCYNHGNLVYSGHGHRVEYTDDYLVFTEDPSERMVFVFANCIIRVKPKVFHHKGHSHAIKKG